MVYGFFMVYGLCQAVHKCTARNDRVHDEGSGMEALEWSLGNEGLGTESWNEGLGMDLRE